MFSSTGSAGATDPGGGSEGAVEAPFDLLAGAEARQVHLGGVGADDAAVFIVTGIGLARVPLHPGQRVTQLVGEDLIQPLRHAFYPRQDDGGARRTGDGAGRPEGLAAALDDDDGREIRLRSNLPLLKDHRLTAGRLTAGLGA